MSQSPSRTSSARSRRSALLLFLPAALVLLFVGSWTGMPWWVVEIGVAVLLVSGLIIGRFGGRRTPAPDAAYGIRSWAARSTGWLSVEAPVEEVMAAVREIGGQLPRFTVVEVSRTGAHLMVAMNVQTWGERITLRFHPAGPRRTEIKALCKPQLRTTMFDYGQGAHDLSALLGAIDRRLTGAAPVQ